MHIFLKQTRSRKRVVIKASFKTKLSNGYEILQNRFFPPLQSKLFLVGFRLTANSTFPHQLVPQASFYIPTSFLHLKYILLKHTGNTSDLYIILQLWFSLPFISSSYYNIACPSTHTSVQSILFSSSFFPPHFFLQLFFSAINSFQFQMKITIRLYYETFSCSDKNLTIQNKANTIPLSEIFMFFFLIFFLKTLMTLKDNQFFSFFLSIPILIFNPILLSRTSIYEQIIQ